jgi:hypothetical protein
LQCALRRETRAAVKGKKGSEEIENETAKADDFHSHRDD